jgi:hypothetical protein
MTLPRQFKLRAWEQGIPGSPTKGWIRMEPGGELQSSIKHGIDPRAATAVPS